MLAVWAIGVLKGLSWADSAKRRLCDLVKKNWKVLFEVADVELRSFSEEKELRHKKKSAERSGRTFIRHARNRL